MGFCDYSCFFHSEEGEQCLELHENCGEEHSEEECNCSYAYLTIFNSSGEKLPSVLTNKRTEIVSYDSYDFQFEGYGSKENDFSEEIVGYSEVVLDGSGLEYPNSFWKYNDEYILNLCPTCYDLLRGKSEVKCEKYRESIEKKHGVSLKEAIEKYKYIVE